MSFSCLAGNPVILRGLFVAAGAAADPDTVSVAVRDPSGATTAPAVTRINVGTYEATITPQITGVWKYKFTGTGAATSVNSDQFLVVPQAF